jgi:hypothetical protein
VTIRKKDRTKGGKIHLLELAFDSSYPTGGEPLSAAACGFDRSIDFLIAEPAAGYTFEYDHTAGTLIARRGDNANASAAPAVEVANAVNLSTVTGVRAFAYGDATQIL